MTSMDTCPSLYFDIQYTEHKDKSVTEAVETGLYKAYNASRRLPQDRTEAADTIFEVIDYVAHFRGEVMACLIDRMNADDRGDLGKIIFTGIMETLKVYGRPELDAQDLLPIFKRFLTRMTDSGGEFAPDGSPGEIVP